MDAFFLQLISMWKGNEKEKDAWEQEPEHSAFCRASRRTLNPAG